MAFLEDPRLRQRWNQITHDAEAVTENAAVGIWSFQHNYITPCLGSIASCIEQCTSLCLGNAEERLRRLRRRRRDRDRGRGAAEYSFDFYDDWYEDEQGGGLLGTWRGEDWDRLLAGTGSQRKHGPAEPADSQPRKKRGMSYGTRAPRRLAGEHDPTIIPSTQPIGFLSKLPWKLGGTLRYRPSAADLQDRPGKHKDGDGDGRVRHSDDAPEMQPLLAGSDDSSDYGELRLPWQRSSTTGSGDTSDSFRSRGDIFPSDGEGEEDAIPLTDDVTYDMIHKDDRSSGRSGRTRSSKGKRPDEGIPGSRTVSRTTLGSAVSAESLRIDWALGSSSLTPDTEHVLPLEDAGSMGHQQQQRRGPEGLARPRTAEAGTAVLMPDVSDMARPLAPRPGPDSDPEAKSENQVDKPAAPNSGSTISFYAARLPRFG